MSEHMSVIKEETERMVNARKAANRIESEREKAIAYHDTVVLAMERIRYHIDKFGTHGRQRDVAVTKIP